MCIRGGHFKETAGYFCGGTLVVIARGVDNQAESKAAACQVWQFNPNLYPLVSSREVPYRKVSASSVVGVYRAQIARGIVCIKIDNVLVPESKGSEASSVF